MSEVQIYAPSAEKPKVQFFSWANLIWTLLTGVLALTTAWATVQVNQSETRKDLENFQSWAREQKQERDEKIEKGDKKIEAVAGDVKQNYVRKDELKGQDEKLNMILEDTKYLRGRVDDLEVRKKNN